MELIHLRGVSKEYRKSTILSNVDLIIEEGDMLGIIGQSGGGKTTLLNLISGFIEPTDGEILYYSKAFNEERDLNKNLHKIKQFIGFTPQHNSFYPKLTVKENLLHFGKLYGISKPILENNIRNLLNFTRLIDHKDKIADELSGGMQKRLDISCSLVHKPRILILDEPTADLDPILQKEILHMLHEVNKQGVTIVIASHQLESIEQNCNKVAIVHNGEVKTEGLIDDIKKPHSKDHFSISVQSGDDKKILIDKLQTFQIKKIIDKGHTLIIYPEKPKETMKDLLEFVQEQGLLHQELHLKKKSLNDVFESIVGENYN